jgi:type IV pilus assembly protein PilY1
MGGQVWRFDIHNGQAAASLVTGGVIADLGVAGGANVAANNRRFYNTPGLFLGNNGGTPYLGVLIGSGWRGHPLSESTTDRFYMIRQTSVFASPSSYTKLTEANLFDATDNLVAQGSAEEQTTATAALTAANGWYITMTRSGEKVLTDPVVINGEVFFSTYEPSSEANVTNPCAVQTGTNWGYRVFATDARPSQDLDGDGVPEIGERAESIPGTGIVGNPTLISTEEGHAMIRGTDTTPVNLGDLEKIKRVYWYENRAR